MELLPIDAFAPRGATLEILADMDKAVEEIRAHQPLPEHISVRLTEDLLYDRIYSSAVTEGNRLSRRETIAVLSAGIVEAGSRKDVAEITNLGRAILLLDEFLQQGIELSEGAVRELHKAVIGGLDLEAGSFRKGEVAIAGSTTVPPAAGDVPDLVNQVSHTVASHLRRQHPVILAAWGHWALTRVHPFRDGNGRVARLVQDYILLRGQYLAAPLFSEDRQGQYYDALEAADSGDTQPFVELIAKNILRVSDRYLSAIREDSLREDWLSAITNTAAERIKQTEHRRFVRWERKMSALKNEFMQLGEELAARVPGLRVNIRDYQGPDLAKYKALRSSGRAERTWVFGVLMGYEEAQLRFVFWAALHHRRPMDFDPDLRDEPVLLVSMEQRTSDTRDQPIFYRQLDDLDEAMISLREVVPHGDALARRRHNPVSEDDEWDLNLTAGQLARDFYTEAMQKLLLA